MAKPSHKQILEELDRLNKVVAENSQESVNNAEKELKARAVTEEKELDEKTLLENSIGEKVLLFNASKTKSSDESRTFIEDMRSMLKKYEKFELSSREKTLVIAAKRVLNATEKQIKRRK